MGRPPRFHVRPDRADALMGLGQLILVGALAVIVLVRVGWGS